MSRSLLLLLAVLFAMAAPLLFSERTLGPWDHVRTFGPWFESPPKTGYDVLQMDGALQFAGWRKQVLESWGRGEVPGWNPYSFGGTPLLSNSQSGALYPLHILFGVAKVPWEAALKWLAVIHALIAAAGVFALSRRYGASEVGAAVGGFAFGASPFVLGWMPLASVMTTACWIPWALWALGAPEPNGPRTPWATPIFVGLMLLGGHLQFAFYGVLAVLIFGIAVAMSQEGSTRWKRLSGIAVLVALGAMLAMPQLGPVLENSKFSHRQTVATAEGYEAYVASAIQPYEWSGLLSMNLLGNLNDFHETGLSTYWPALAKRGANPAESAVTLSAALVLIPAAFLRRKRTWVAPTALLAVAFLLAAGTPLNALFYYGVPGFAATGSPGRAAVLFVLAGCVLAAIGFTQVQGLAMPSEKTDEPKAPIWLLASFIGVPTLVLLLRYAPATAWSQGLQDVLEAFKATSFGGLYPWIGPLILALVFLGRKVPRYQEAILAGGCALVVLVEALSVMPRTGTPLVLTPGLGEHQRIATINRAWEILVPQPALLPPNLGSLYGVRELGGYDSLIHRDTVAMLRDLNRQDPAPPTNGNMMFIKSPTSLEALGELGVSEVWSLDAENGWRRTPVPGPGRASIEGRPVEWIEDGANRVALKATGPGRLILRDRNLPGWSVTVDGAPAKLEGELWREVVLPEGEHTVAFAYHPIQMSHWAMFGVAALLIGAIGLKKPSTSAASTE